MIASERDRGMWNEKCSMNADGGEKVFYNEEGICLVLESEVVFKVG